MLQSLRGYLPSHLEDMPVLDSRHAFFPKFVSLMQEAAAKPPVYDLGTSSRFAKEVGLLRHLFDEAQYFAGGFRPDMSLGNDSCDLDCDLHNLASISDETVGSVLCLSVLEHVLRPAAALSEVFRILKPGGIAVVSVPFLAAYHGKTGMQTNPVYLSGRDCDIDSSHTTYGDFWRPTHEGLALMFGDAGFRRVDVFPVDGRVVSRLQLLGIYASVARIPGIRELISHFDQPQLGRATSHHFVRAQK